MPSSQHDAFGIAYLVSRYPAVSHTFILREIAGLRRLGARIEVASVNTPDRAYDAMPEQEKQEADRTYYIKHDGWMGALQALCWSLLQHPASTLRTVMTCLSYGPKLMGLAYAIEALMVAHWMHRKNLRHLHVHFGNAAATVGMLVKRITGHRLSLTIHGPDEFDDVFGQRLADKVAAADQIICISQFGRSQLMRLSHPDHWQKLQVCRLGVDTSALTVEAPKVELPRTVELLCVGRLTPAKAQSLLLDSVAKLLAGGDRIKLTLIGDGPDRQRLQDRAEQLGISDRIDFKGAQTSDQVAMAMRRADIFVLPSFAEGIPVVLMEAMALGTVCVSTPVNGIPELIRHGVDGLLATPGDLDSLTTQLHTLINTPSLRQKLGASARSRVEAHFHLDTNVQQLHGMLRSQKHRQPDRVPHLVAATREAS